MRPLTPEVIDTPQRLTSDNHYYPPVVSIQSIQVNQAARPNTIAATPPISPALSGPAAPALLEAEAAAVVPLTFSDPVVIVVAAETAVEISVVVTTDEDTTTKEVVATLAREL
jgi:hypothetical protein